MSVIVLYDGKRYNVKVGPTTSVQQIIIESCAILKIDSSKACLKHKKTLLDPSSPFKFTGIPLNSVLDLVMKDSAKVELPVRVALTLEGRAAGQGTFPASATLAAILEQLSSDGTLPRSIVDFSPEIIYLRQSFCGESLSNTSLSSLGLAGQSARFQLRLQDKSAAAFVPLIDSSQSPIENLLEAGDDSKMIEVQKSSTAIAMDVDDILVPQPAISPTQAEGRETGPEVPSLIVPVSAPICQPSEKSSLEMQKLSNLPGSIVIPAGVPDNCLSSLGHMLATYPHTSPVLTSAIQLLLRYISNVLDRPEDSRVRTIRIANNTFQERLAGVTGAREVLQGAGFEALSPASGEELRLCSPSEDSFQRQRLFAVKSLLLSVIEYLGTGGEPSSASSAATKMETSAPVFDPFKPHIHRVNPQPRGGESITEMKLQSLLKRKDELMDALNNKASEITATRHTAVVAFPGAGLGSNQSIAHTTAPYVEDGEGNGEGDAEPGDGRLIMQAMARRGTGHGDEGPPLTTRAMRELSALEKERLYEEVLVRVRFADRVVVQGRFHPSEDLKAVRQWLVTDCIREEVLREQDFELVLPEGPRGPSGGSDSLQQLGLAPAALLRLHWVAIGTEGGTAEGSGGRGELTTGRAVGGYLRESLLLSADPKGPEIGSVPIAFPEGKSVWTAPSISACQAKNTLGSAADPVSGSSEACEPKKANKPKWLKI